MAVSGRGARQKGLNFERDVANKLRGIFPGARRQLEFQIEDANGVDLQNTGPFKFQCKKLKRYAPVATIREIKFEPLAGEVPVLVTAGDREPAMAVLSFNDFIWLLESFKGVIE
jgi:hypothetical protein